MSIFWLDCESHRYGLNCSFDCGHCKDGKPCSTVTGNCFDGCEDEWTGKLCDIGIYHTYFYQKTAHTCISNPTHLNIIIIVSFYYNSIFFSQKSVRMEHMYQTESVSSVKDCVRTGHPVISQLENVIMDAMTTGPVNSVKVRIRKMMIDIVFGMCVCLG